jgi:hypothetical protein
MNGHLSHIEHGVGAKAARDSKPYKQNANVGSEIHGM